MNHCLTYADVTMALPLIVLTAFLLGWLCGIFTTKLFTKGKEDE